MNKTLKCVMLSMLLVIVSSYFVYSQADDPVAGKWKLNLAKSKHDPGPAPRSETRIIENRGDGVMHMTSEGIDAKGNRTFEQCAFKFDGKDYPYLVLGSKTVGTISLKAIDTYTIECIRKDDGKVVSTGTRTISRDGKIYTITSKGTNAQGQQVSSVAVYERQ